MNISRGGDELFDGDNFGTEREKERVSKVINESHSHCVHLLPLGPALNYILHRTWKQEQNIIN